MKNLFAAIFASVVIAFSGAAFAQAMSGTFGNTVTVSDAEGTLLATYFFNEDGTFSLTGADGTEAAGTWTEADGELCMTLGEETSCNAVDGGHGPGDTWEAAASDGSMVTISITEGR